MSGENPYLLEVRDLKKYFPVTSGIVLARRLGFVRAVDGVSFATKRGQTFGLVGESGSGKTTTSRMVLRVETPTGGQVRFKGQDIFQLSKRELRGFRSVVQAVFQDPYSSLDPRMRVGKTIAEPLVTDHHRHPEGEVKERVRALLTLVGLKPEHESLYPHEFSGGMRQRIAIARALAPNPELIVLDEPVSALDVSIRAQIMNLLKELQGRYGFAYLLIAHNLATVRHLSHRMGVMYVGKLVEEGGSEEIFTHPLHPYTQALIQASLPIHPDSAGPAAPLRGEVPSPLTPPPGCRLHPRCPRVMPVCSQEEPALWEVAPGHHVGCFLYK